MKLRKNRPQVIVNEPICYQWVSNRFQLSGYVTGDFLIKNKTFGILDVEITNLNCQTIFKSSIPVDINHGEMLKADKLYPFSVTFELSRWTYPFLRQANGMFGLFLGDATGTHKFVPLIAKEFTSKPIASEEKKLLWNTPHRIQIFLEKQKEYHNELDELSKRRQQEFSESLDQEYTDEVNVESTEIIHGLHDVIENFPDHEMIELDVRFAEVLKWGGSLFRGSAGEIDGFSFMVHSDDHGRHFHVIHNGKGINARFSYPEIKLIDYKMKHRQLKSKEIKKIQSYFEIQTNFEKLSKEFNKRESI